MEVRIRNNSSSRRKARWPHQPACSRVVDDTSAARIYSIFGPVPQPRLTLYPEPLGPSDIETLPIQPPTKKSKTPPCRLDGLDVAKGPVSAFNTFATMCIPPLVDERRSRKLASDGRVTAYAKQPPYYSPDSGIMHWLLRMIVDSRYESFMK
mgnify:CR=1 FL=1